MKTCVCCIAKNEERYINEWINHYINLGFDTIFIYDNNDENLIRDVIPSELILSKKVIIYDARGKKQFQGNAYHHCYHTYKNEYDWFAFLDVDEFLQVNEVEFPTVKDCLASSLYRNSDCIFVNWLVYGDNDLVHYEDKPVVERFTKPIPLFKHIDFEECPQDQMVKSIVRGGINSLVFNKINQWGTVNPHYPEGIQRYTNVIGMGTRPSINQFIIYDPMYIAHYYTKTVEEWAMKKKRGWADRENNEETLSGLGLEAFYKVNEETPEKTEAFNKIINS